MNKYIFRFKAIYECMQTREKILLSVLCWVILYAVFYLTLYRSLEYKKEEILVTIKEETSQIDNWNTQIIALNKISTSPLYKEWQQQHQSFMSMRGQYKIANQSQSSDQWENIIKNLLHQQPNITLIEMKNFPPTIYKPINIAESIDPGVQLYQQQLMLIIISNYFDTLSYVQELESQLPSIHWDSLNYEVTEYPIAKVKLEFSIFYEKNNS